MRAVLFTVIALFMVVFPAFAHHTLDITDVERTQDVETLDGRRKHVDGPSFESGPPRWDDDDDCDDSSHWENKRSNQDVPVEESAVLHKEPKRFTPLNYREPQETDQPSGPVIPKSPHVHIGTTRRAKQDPEGDSSRSTSFIPPQNVHTPRKMQISNRKPTLTTEVVDDSGPTVVPA